MHKLPLPHDWTLDHLIFAARRLDEGQTWLEEQLGTPLLPGGQHPRFGTYNRLLGLGRAYLEIIAIDPAAGPVSGPRWFELDSTHMQARLADRPRLIHWVAAVPSLTGHPQAQHLERGSNRWQLTVADDGSLPSGGLEPSLIAWDTPSPAHTLPPSGVTLQQLELCGPDPEFLQHWTGQYQGIQITATQSTQVELRATFHTPNGPITLS